MRKTFTWFIGLMVLLTSFATNVVAQNGAQETVELYAEDTSYCYNEVDDYAVSIAVSDFIKLDSFELVLLYDDTMFDFVAENNVHTELSAGLTVSETTSGAIELSWDDATTTFADNVYEVIMDLHFSVVGFPDNTTSPVYTDLIWDKVEFWYTDPTGTDTVRTEDWFDGSLAVNVEMTGIETTVTTETCAGGDVTLTVTDPDAAYYLFNEDPNPANWENAWSTSPDYQVEAGDIVTVRVKNESGCISLMETVEIPETIEPLSYTVETQDPQCYGGKGSVIINATGGSAPYTYYINSEPSLTGADDKSSFQWSQDTGDYWVAVQDANDCADLSDSSAMWTAISITDTNVVVDGTITVDNVGCYGGTDGAITVTITEDGSTTLEDTYEVSVDGGVLTWGEPGVYTVDGLAAGDYNVKVRNSDGCVVTIDDSVTVTEPDPITFDISVEDVQCGSANDGEIAVYNIAGGSETTYTLVLESSTTSDTLKGVAVTDTFTALMPTYYSLTVIDEGGAGCEAEYSNPNGTGNVIAVQSPEDINYEVEITDPLCHDEMASVAILNVTGGTGFYEYTFDGGTTWVDTTTIDSWDYTDTLNISVRNDDGSCPVPYPNELDSSDVNNPDPLLASVSDVFPPTCVDGNDGNVYLNVNGGTQPYYYSINGSSWRQTEYDNLAIIKVGVGPYTIMVKDDNECEISPAIKDTVRLQENVITASSDTLIECFGDNTGTISVEFESWSDSLDVDSLPNRSIDYYVENETGNVSSFDPSVATFTAGTYIVWVEDQYGCTSNMDTVVIEENPDLIIEGVTATGASCFGTYEGTITIYASGGTTTNNPLQYAFVNNEEALGSIEESKWTNFQDYDPETGLSTVSFQVDGGTYYIAVRDDCTEETFGSPVVIEGYEELLVDEGEITWTDPLCNGDSTGTITVPLEAVSGGAGTYLFTLLDGTGAEVEGYVDLALGEFTGLPAGTYAVLVEDTEDCPAYTTNDITLADPPALDFAIDSTHMTCPDANNGLITVSIDVDDTGTPDYWYAINNQNTWIAFGEDKTTKTYIATEPGTFNVWVKDANGCVAGPKQATILEPEALDADITVTDASCPGGEGSITVSGSGGWGDLTTDFWFKINDGNWVSTTTFDLLPAGDHMLYISDSTVYTDDAYPQVCSNGVSFTIEEPDPIVYDVEIDDVKCKDGADGSLTVEVLSGGTPFANDGYHVNVTGSGFNQWAYTDEDYMVTFDNLEQSFYTVYIYDSLGCGLKPTTYDSISPYETIESWEVSEPATYLELTADFEQDASCYGVEDGKFSVSATGGTPPYMYYTDLSVEPDGHILTPPAPAADSDEWQTSSEFEVGAGTWVVWVMDANECIVGGETDDNDDPVNEWRVRIDQPDSIQWQFHTIGGEVHYTMPQCYGSWNGEIHIEASDTSIIGGAGVYNATVTGTSAAGEPVDTTYTDIQNNGAIYVLGGIPASDSTGFEVMVTDTNGCMSAAKTIIIDQPEELMVDLVTAEGSFTCAGAVEGLIEAEVTGGTPYAAGELDLEEYEYQLWKNGQVHTPWQRLGSAFLVEVGNTFVVEVRDSTGCVAKDTIDIEPVAEVLVVSVDDRTCYGEDVPTAVISATAEEGRMLYARVQKVDGSDVGAWSEWMVFNEEEGEGTHVFHDVLTYGDENEIDGHYNFQVKDEMDCMSEVYFKTFVPVQTQLMLSTEVDGNLITANATGGAVDTEGDHHYEYSVSAVDAMGDLVWQESNELVVDSFDTYVVYARDYHHCWTTDTVETGFATMIVAEIQGDGDVSPVENDVVGVTGTVTAVVDGEGFFMQDDNGAGNGIWVEYADAASLTIGAGVHVLGTVAEVESVTTILADEVTDATAPVVVVADTLASPSAAIDEMYESVLVVVEGAWAAEANEDGQWEIYYETSDSVVVNNWIYTYTPTAGNVYHVTGVVNGKADAYMLEPRMESDIVDVTATTPVEPEIELVEFKAYPNPFNDHIKIDNNDKLTRVVISNIAGQRVMDLEYPNHEIRTGKLVSGVYVISMFTEDGLAKSARMIKR